MSEQEKFWREKAKSLKVTPSERVWDRLESRLDQDEGKIPHQLISRWVGVAATFLVLLGASLYFFSTPKPHAETVVKTHDLEELRPAFAAYRYVNDLKSVYQDKTWPQINEGQHRPLILRANYRYPARTPVLDQSSDSSQLY